MSKDQIRKLRDSLDLRYAANLRLFNDCITAMGSDPWSGDPSTIAAQNESMARCEAAWDELGKGHV